jgi:hypothetical protein
MAFSAVGKGLCWYGPVVLSLELELMFPNGERLGAADCA